MDKKIKETIRSLPLRYRVMIADIETQNTLRTAQMKIQTIMISKADDKEKSKELLKIWDESTKVLKEIWSDYFEFSH